MNARVTEDRSDLIDRMTRYSGARSLFVAACVVVVVAGLRVAKPILLPFSLALFLAVLTLPITVALRKKRIPTPLAVFVGVLVDVAVFGLVILLAAQSVGELQDNLEHYTRRFRDLWAAGIERLSDFGLPVSSYATLEFIDADRFVNLLGSTVQGVASLLTSTFLVVLIMVFLLNEATIFPAKFRAIIRRPAGAEGRFRKIVGEVQEYLGIKTLVSLATGILIGLWAWLMGLDFPVLLGVIGFALNYIPTIGSVLASIPGMALALVQYSVGHMLIVGAGYAVVNVVFGNVIEPSLLGRRLGLSTLVVLLSLMFWGWVWGPVGMLLAVPLTMVTKIMLENTGDLRWIAVLLDKSAPPEDARLAHAVPLGGAAETIAGPLPGTAAIAPADAAGVSQERRSAG